MPLMGADVQFISEVDNAVENGSVARRTEMLRRVTDLFVVGAPQLSETEIALFDDVITRLAIDIEISARALLAIRLAPIPNAPPQTIRTLAFDDALEVAAPVLSLSKRLDDRDLIENAKNKSQGHLLAISQRLHLSEAVTDVLVERGDQQVLQSTVENCSAMFSHAGFSILVQRADGNERLAISVGARPEIPPQLFRQLLEKASQRARAKLAVMHPEASHEIAQVIAEVSSRMEAEAQGGQEDYSGAMAMVAAARSSGELDDGYVRKLAQAGARAEVTAALAMICDLPLPFVEQIMKQRRSDILLVLARAADLSWPTVKAILMLRSGKSVADTEIAQCLAAYERLGAKAAQQIVQFYRSREKNA
jgi:uncharacterized protein (DUF2336 family)